MSKIGEFDPHLRPLIRVVMRGIAGREQTIEARLDTGFDLSLAVPVSVIESLGLQYVKTRPIMLASGEAFYFREYSARILWEGIERPIRVLAKPGFALVGVALFSGYRLTLEIADGGAINCNSLN